MATAISGNSPQKSARQPRYWMMGAPTVTPMTGPPAPTSAHHPMALTRSSAEKTCKMRAIEAAPVAAPSMPSKTRAVMSRPAVGAEAVSTTQTAAPTSPHRYSRRRPQTSPIFPSTGAATPKASNGPVDVQVRVETEVWSSPATFGSATTKTVNVMLTDNKPASTVHSTHHWYRSDVRTRSWAR